ncbi:MAG: DNA-binding CsgD family transcriptional regulator [Paraglaciecola sp.]|jgi:DNA-binding CsgD family transcriptional regulator
MLGYKQLLNDGGLNPLKEDEFKVVKLLCHGYRLDEIAGLIFKTRDSVNLYIKNAKNHLSVQTRDQLVAVAVARGIVKVELSGLSENLPK